MPLREFLVTKLKRDAGINCTVDDLLIVSGSLQALDLVNATLLTRGDTVIFEQDSYQGSLTRLARLGVNIVGIPLDKDGMRMDVLASTLADLKGRGIRPKYIYTIPTVQNPTGSIMPESRRAELVRLASRIWRAHLRGRLLCRSRLVGTATAGDPRDEPERRRDPYRLVLEIDRTGAARRLHRRALGCDVADAGAEDGCRLRRAGADGAGRLLQAALFDATCRH